MKKIAVLCVVAASVAAGFSRPVFGQGQVLQLAQSKHCIACHQLEKRMIGPPFAAIAQRFRGETAAIAHLSARIREGSRGAWGAIGMPRQDGVNQEEAEQLAAWILSLYRDADSASSQTLEK